MKLLLENWRKYLTEGMKTITDLPDDSGIVIQKYGNGWQIDYTAIDDPMKDPKDGPSGGVEITRPRPAGGRFPAVPCLAQAGEKGPWQIHTHETTHGWGPLLYDIAMEWASMHGGGLMSDRAEGISSEALAVWNHYLKHLPRGIKVMQMDDLKNTLTPEEWDNCKQHDANRGSPENLHSSPLSKRFLKKADTIKALQKAGRLTIIE